MKILAIRGKNLTSLAGEFEISFQQEPLASAGLFAISGPTGAGKSTLLDALCLALYDDTPRLLKAGNMGAKLPDVTGETVTPHDTRTLLRRGASDGYAEVDFVGNDGGAYRARWSVRRSRTRVDGRLQSLEMTLKSLPGLQPIGGVNREVKAEIVQRIGLNFEQFTRSVLLAQNEFSAFLKADDNERGELLETLTGIVIYSAISKRAFERAKAEQASLDRLNDRLADQKPLSPDARAQLDSDSCQADQALALLDRKKKTLDEHLRWHDALSKAQQSVSLAEQEWDRLLAASVAAAPRRADFERVVAVQAARALQADCERIEAEIAQSGLEMVRIDVDLAQAAAALQAAEVSKDLAGRDLLAAEQRQIIAMPDLDHAKALDAQLETLAPLHLQARQMRAAADAAAAHAVQALQENEKLRVRALQERQQADDWLAQQARLRTLAEGWPRWDTLLVQATKIAQEQAALNKVSASSQQEEVRLSRAVIEADARQDAALQAMHQAEFRREAGQRKLDEYDVPARLTRKQTVETRRDALRQAEQQWLDLAGNLAAQRRLDEEAGQLQNDIGRDEYALQQLAEPLCSTAAALAQAERSLKTAEAACAENVETLRAALKEYEACPVCGALDHPYRSVTPQLHAMLDSLRAEVMRCRDSLQTLRQQHTEHQTRATGNRRQAEEVARQSLTLVDAIKAGLAAWQFCPLAGELDGIAEGERRRWFADQQQVLRVQWQAIVAEEQAERDAAALRDNAQTEYDCAARHHMICKDAAIEAQASLVKVRAECAANRDKLALALQRIEATLAELDIAFDNQEWRDAWRNAPVVFHEECKARVRQWQTCCGVRDESGTQAGKLEAARAALLQAQAKADLQAGQSAAAEAEGAANIGRLRSARLALFGGKASRQIQAELDAAIASAKESLAGQDKWVLQKSHQKIRLEEAQILANRLLARQRQDAASACAALADWISRFNCVNPDAPITLEQLRILLAHQPDWIAEERKRLQAIASALENAKTVLHERLSLREIHEQARPTADSQDALKQALTLLEGELQATRREAAALQLAIAQDQARRMQSAAMLAELEKQEAACRLWAQLSELIGSADGKKFRNYAQQYTLDVLLGYANRHLAELSRRYRLERIADTLALMVVDQDMGDELRSVHSLSGGESFLVSLALALGLASLSSNRVRVESLFIDEGFGSLDAETLSVAMDALDGLQAMGRKVGVISHVQEMTERISAKVLVQRMAGGKSQVRVV